MRTSSSLSSSMSNNSSRAACGAARIPNASRCGALPRRSAATRRRRRRGSAVRGWLGCVEQQREQLAASFVEAAESCASRELLFETHEHILRQRLAVRHLFRFLVERRLPAARGHAAAKRSPRGTLGGSEDPGSESVWLLESVQALEERRENLLKDVSRRVIVQARA